jgi:glyceraldehyde-3-phosphate dehydrogenase/erythrose-4-phosphate dehydrogenase
MFKYDSVHGRFKGTIEAKDGKLWINDKPITIYAQKDPTQIPWAETGAERFVRMFSRFIQCVNQGRLHNDRKVNLIVNQEMDRIDMFKEPVHT